MAQAGANSSSANVLVVDWSALTDFGTNYPQLFNAYAVSAVKSVPIVGNRTGELLQFLINSGKTNLDLIHFVGHSLGAHVSGKI